MLNSCPPKQGDVIATRLNGAFPAFSMLLLLAGISFVSCNTLPPADKDNAGLLLPDGFVALAVVDTLPAKARHLTVNENGDIYVKGRRDLPGGINWALRDTDGDGKADSIINFGPYTNEGSYSTGMRIYKGYLYTGAEHLVYRYKLKKNELVPTSAHEVIVADSGRRREHMTKPFAFDNEGNIYVPFGAPSDACQEMNRIASSPGLKPCPLLDSNAGVWKFNANKTNQFRMKDGEKVATGLRSIVGIEWNDADNALYAVTHGRDGLNRTWPQLFDQWQAAVLPAEGLYKLTPGMDAGWPYYYFDQMKGRVMLNPEYGGDGKMEGDNEKISHPVVGFPGHWAPNDLLFYKGNQFPARYKQGAFVAFHGSTDRAPYPQAGYTIGFVPIIDGKAGPMEIFADGFTGVDTVVNTSDATYRPMGLAEGPDGSLYIAETEKGKIWRVMFTGDKKAFSDKNLAKMKERENRTYVKNPDPIKDNLDNGKAKYGGEELYKRYCRSCHNMKGLGDGNRFPPLVNSEWVNGDKKRLISVLLKGLQGPIKVDGKQYNNVMPAYDFLEDDELSSVLSYVKRRYGNNPTDTITPQLVSKTRKQLLK